MNNSKLRKEAVALAKSIAGINTVREESTFNEEIKNVYHTIDNNLHIFYDVEIELRYNEKRFDFLTRENLLSCYVSLIKDELERLKTSFLDFKFIDDENFSINPLKYTSKDVTDENFYVGAVDGIYSDSKNNVVVVINNEVATQYDKIDTKVVVTDKEELFNELYNIPFEDLIKNINLEGLNIKLK